MVGEGVKGGCFCLEERSNIKCMIRFIDCNVDVLWGRKYKISLERIFLCNGISFLEHK